VLTLVVNTLGGQLIAVLNRLTPAEGFNVSGMLQNRGEFVLILATLATASGLDPRLTPFAGLYVLIMAIIGPVLAVNSEKAGARIFRRRRRATVTRDAGRDRDFALAEAAMSGGPGDETAALEVAASESPFEFAEVTGGVDDDELPRSSDRQGEEKRREERLAEQAGAQSDVTEPPRPPREPDPEY
jgi:CPA2 family monovalent cation:H+ antiporter-2